MKMHRAAQAERSPSGTRVAFGRATIGALAIRALAVKRGKIGHLAIEELEVGRLCVRDLIVEREQTPRGGPLDGSGA
jgi:hypothetical protein